MDIKLEEEILANYQDFARKIDSTSHDTNFLECIYKASVRTTHLVKAKGNKLENVCNL